MGEEKFQKGEAKMQCGNETATKLWFPGTRALGHLYEYQKKGVACGQFCQWVSEESLRYTTCGQDCCGTDARRATLRQLAGL